MKYLKRKYATKSGFKAEWRAALDAYAARLAAVTPALPESARQLVDHENRWPFHDATVDRVDCSERGRLTIELDSVGRSGRRLEFLEVHECSCPEPVAGGECWLYTEIDAAPHGCFELRALWSDSELRVVAREVRLYDYSACRYVIPDVAPAAPPTLFLDRTRDSHKR